MSARIELLLKAQSGCHERSLAALSQHQGGLQPRAPTQQLLAITHPSAGHKSGKGGAAAERPASTWVAVQQPIKKRKSEAGTAVPSGGQQAGGLAGGEHSDGEEAGPASPTKGGRAEVLAHNAAIKADAQAMAGRRFDFLDRHLQVGG